MPEYRIRRDGQQYLVFSGHVVAEASDRLRHGHAHDRWTDIQVYRTDSGSYVVEQVLRSLWQKGDAVWYQGNLEKDLLHQLAAQDPCFAELLTEQKRCQE